MLLTLMLVPVQAPHYVALLLLPPSIVVFILSLPRRQDTSNIVEQMVVRSILMRAMQTTGSRRRRLIKRRPLLIYLLSCDIQQLRLSLLQLLQLLHNHDRRRFSRRQFKRSRSRKCRHSLRGSRRSDRVAIPLVLLASPCRRRLRLVLRVINVFPATRQQSRRNSLTHLDRCHHPRTYMMLHRLGRLVRQSTLDQQLLYATLLGAVERSQLAATMLRLCHLQRHQPLDQQCRES